MDHNAKFIGQTHKICLIVYYYTQYNMYIIIGIIIYIKYSINSREKALTIGHVNVFSYQHFLLYSTIYGYSTNLGQ